MHVTLCHARPAASVILTLLALAPHPRPQRPPPPRYARALAEAEAEVEKRKQEKVELEAAISDVQSTLQASLEAAADSMMGKVEVLAAERARQSAAMQRRSSACVEDDEWEDEDALPNGPTPSSAAPAGGEEARLRAKLDAAKTEQTQLQGEDETRQLSPEEERMLAEARLEAYERALKELEEKTRIQQNAAEACRVKQADWKAKLAEADGCGKEGRVPILPIGDAILEPFWPQGLGSNRGFHSALDAVWAVHVLHTSGTLDAALLERNFWCVGPAPCRRATRAHCLLALSLSLTSVDRSLMAVSRACMARAFGRYDLMLQGPWQPLLLKPAKGWACDPVTRYVDGATVRTKANYTNRSAKRLFRGAGATPARIEALGLKAVRGAGGANAFM